MYSTEKERSEPIRNRIGLDVLINTVSVFFLQYIGY